MSFIFYCNFRLVRTRFRSLPVSAHGYNIYFGFVDAGFKTTKLLSCLPCTGGVDWLRQVSQWLCADS